MFLLKLLLLEEKLYSELVCTLFVAKKLKFITSILLFSFVAFSLAVLGNLTSARNQIQMAPARLSS